MTSKKSHEGYLLIDNSNSPGVPDAIIPDKYAFLRGTGTRKLEFAVLTCAHCHDQLLKNPVRARPRSYCRHCDHYICDKVYCNSGCHKLNDLIDKFREEKVLADQSSGDPTARIIIP
jgi:hypothetical protein